MAKILYEVKKNQNSHSAAFGKWYAQIKNLETLNTRKLANHISEHGSIYTPDVVYGVLEKFRSCLLEMLLNSKKVKIEGLGTFYCTLENQKNGALKKEDFTLTRRAAALTTAARRPVTTPRVTTLRAVATRVAVARPFPAKATKQSEGALPQQGSLHSYQPLKTT